MSMTYANAETEARAHSRSEPAAFVPRYARPTKSKKAVKTWMILAPIGAVVLLGSAAAMMMRGEEGPAPFQSVETVTPETESATAALSAAVRCATGRPKGTAVCTEVNSAGSITSRSMWM